MKGFLSHLDVSVGICAYNEEANIANLMSNLLSQSLPENFDLREIIVVASGCTDNTERKVKKYQELDKRVKLIIQKERCGKASAVNLLLKECSSQIIIMESADTIPAPETIGKLVRPLLDPRVGGTAARPIPINDGDSAADHISTLIWRYLHHELSSRKCRLSGELFAIRAGIVRKIPPEIVHDDVYIQHCIGKQAYKLVYVPDAFVFMKGPETITDLIKQRRKNIGGFLQLRQYTGITEPTVSPTKTLSILTKTLLKIQHLRAFIYIMFAVILEAYAHLLARHDIKTNDIPIGLMNYRVASTKKLECKEYVRNHCVNKENKGSGAS